MSDRDQTPDPITERIVRLEEAQLFAERTAEELGDEVLALGRKLDALTARLARLEQQIAAQSQPAPGQAPHPPVPGDDPAPGAEP